MKKFEETVIKNGGEFFGVKENGEMTYEIKGLTSSPLIIFGDWVSPDDPQAEIAKLNSKIDWLHGLLDGRNEEVLQTVKRLNEAQPEIREVPQFEEEFDNLIRAFVEYHDCFDFDTEKYYLELKKEFIEKYGKKQQPEIPVFVAEVVENHDLETLANWANLVPLLSTQVRSWLLSSDLVGHSYTYLLADLKINGYTVAKEKRFYLKNKSVLIFDPDSDDSDVEELYLGAGGNFVPYKHLAKIFTQSQIDSMETGSYEQFEVEE